MTSTHNLDINNYSLDEIFSLFDLNYNLTEESMRAAKMKVLMIQMQCKDFVTIYI